MRLRWLGAAAGIGTLALLRAGAAGPRAFAVAMAAESTLAAGVVAVGARRFTAEPVAGRDGTGVGYHIDAVRLFDLAVGSVGRGRRVDGGLVVVDYGRLGRHVNPAHTAWWALAHFNHYADTGDDASRAAALASVEALTAAAERRDDEVVWTYGFDWPVCGRMLHAPWISAMAQGLAISALVRAYRVERDEGLLCVARAAATPFERSPAAGGVRMLVRGRPYYEEYPCAGGSLVLDGSLFGLLGLYDLWAETGDAAIRRLFDAGVEGIAANLDLWNVGGLWSRYGRDGRLSPPMYHRLNAALLDAAGRLADRPELCRTAAAWGRSVDGPRRVAAYLAYQAALVAVGLRSKPRAPWRSTAERTRAAACAG